MGEFGERETCEFFGHLAALNVDERNDLDEYLSRCRFTMISTP